MRNVASFDILATNLSVLYIILYKLF